MPKEQMHAGHGGKLAKYGMWACCAIMLIPVAGFFLAGGAGAGMSQTLTAFAPLILCVGAHLVMHKMMGKSCHGGDQAKTTPESTDVIEEPRAGKRAVAVSVE